MIVSTHGIKGEVRVDPWCDSADFIKQFKTLYFDEALTKPVKVLSARPHGNVCIVKLDGIDTPEAAQKYRQKILYCARADVKNHEGWFIQDLLECTVRDYSDQTRVYGKITDCFKTGANDVWTITDESGTEYMIPVIDDVVKSVDIDGETVLISPLKGIFSDAVEA